MYIKNLQNIHAYLSLTNYGEGQLIVLPTHCNGENPKFIIQTTPNECPFLIGATTYICPYI